MYEIGLLASDTSMCGRTEIPMNDRRITKAHQKDTCQAGSHKGNNTVLKLPDLLLKYSKIGGGGGDQGCAPNDKKWKFLHKIIGCGDLLNSPR